MKSRAKPIKHRDTNTTIIRSDADTAAGSSKEWFGCGHRMQGIDRIYFGKHVC